MQVSRTLVASMFFLSVMIANVIQRVYPNDITSFMQNTAITMLLYTIALATIFYPILKRGGITGFAVTILCVVLGALLTYVFWMM